MGAQRILFITSESACLYLRHGRRLHQQVCFGRSSADGLAEHLAEAPHLPTWVLVDIVEEDFRLEQVAHAFGRDRVALLKRHSRRLFRNTPYRHTQLLGRSRHNRHKDEVLFSALINPERIDPWLEELARHDVPVTGICSLPLLSAELLKPLHCRREEVLLISHQRGAGLRQSFFRKGQLIFSRLSQVPDDLAGRDYVANLESEVAQTQRYLYNLRLLERGQPVKARILSGGEILAALQAGLQGGDDREYGLFDLADLARRLGCPAAPEDHFAESLFACLLTRGRHANHYARPSQRRQHFTRLARQGVQFGAASLAGMGLLWSGINLADGLLYQQQAEALQPAVARAQARYQRAQAAIPETPYTAQEIEGAVMLADALNHRRRNPQRLLTRIGRSLTDETLVHLDRIDWFVADDPHAKPPGERDNSHTEEESAGGEGPALADGTGRYEIALLGGRLLPFDGNYRRAHDRVQRLAEKLARLPGVLEVKTLAWPLNTDPGTPVSGGVGQEGKDQEARFLLRLVAGGGS